MLKLRKRNYKILGIKESSIKLFKGYLRDDIKIISHATKGRRFIVILIPLDIIEVIKFKLCIRMYNLKHRNKLKLVKVGA